MRIYRSRRTGRSRRRGQVLILLAGYLFLGGSAAAGCWFLTGRTGSQIDKALKKLVDDDESRTAARAAVERWENDADDFFERTSARRKKLLELFERRDAQRSAIDALFAEQDADVDRMTSAALDHRFELRGLLAAEEWAAVFPAPPE